MASVIWNYSKILKKRYSIFNFKHHFFIRLFTRFTSLQIKQVLTELDELQSSGMHSTLFREVGVSEKILLNGSVLICALRNNHKIEVITVWLRKKTDEYDKETLGQDNSVVTNELAIG